MSQDSSPNGSPLFAFLAQVFDGPQPKPQIVVTEVDGGRTCVSVTRGAVEMQMVDVYGLFEIAFGLPAFVNVCWDQKRLQSVGFKDLALALGLDSDIGPALVDGTGDWYGRLASLWRELIRAADMGENPLQAAAENRALYLESQHSLDPAVSGVLDLNEVKRARAEWLAARVRARG